MTLQDTGTTRTRTRGTSFLSIVNGSALLITLLFWACVLFGHLVPFPGSLASPGDRANAAVTYGFMVGDLAYSVPLLFLACTGLWRLKSWGWMSAQMVNILWIYSMTVILLRDAYTTLSPGGALFIPFTIVALWAIPYLWMRRENFGIAR